MRKIAKYIICFALILGMIFGGCNQQGGAPAPVVIKESDVSFWSCSANEKILADMDKNEYEDIATPAMLSIFMAKGEYESGQIIISPSVDIPYYNATVSDLTLRGGTDKIEKKDIDVYKQVYIDITLNFEKNGAPMGKYPDGLVPMSSIVEYKQNTIKKGTNQGLYITIESALDQTPGIYEGTLSIDFQSFVKSIPISVEVFSLEVSETVRTKSTFRTNTPFEHGELNLSQEMFDAYSQALVDFRLAPSSILLENDHSDESIRRYVEKSYEFLRNPRCSNVSIPYKEVTRRHPENNVSYLCIEPATLEKYLYAFAAKSFETEFDMVKKLIMYNAIIDEARLMKRPYEQVELNNTVFNQTVKKVAKAIEDDTTITSSIKDEVVNSILNIPYVFTTEYWEEFTDPTSDSYANTFCPMYNHCDSPAARAQYDGLLEKWWYNCNKPYYPYGNYHIDFTTTVPIRAIGWQQADYGFVGNLYWAVNYYTDGVKGDRNIFDEDYFGGSGHKMGLINNANGEGRLFYPGGQYGLDYPLPSLRLMAIRDGLEEYELIYSLKEKYKEKGFSADNLVATLGASVYTGTQTTANSIEFDSARKSLFTLCAAAQSSAEMCIVDAKDDTNGAIDYKVYIKDGYEIKCDGVVVENYESHGEGKIYSIKKQLNKDVNFIEFSFTADGVEFTYTQSLGGKIEMVAIEKLASAISKTGQAEVSSTMQSGEVKVELGATVDAIQTARFTLDEVSSLNANSSKISFIIRNESDEDISMGIAAKYKKNVAMGQETTFSLKKNESTVITIFVDTIDWAKTGNIEYFRFKFFNSGDDDIRNESQKTIFIEKLLVYGK